METNWDPAKACANPACHGIAFEDAELALSDPAGLTREDPDALGRIVAVVYTYRDADIRLISARASTRRERETYAQGI